MSKPIKHPNTVERFHGIAPEERYAAARAALFNRTDEQLLDRVRAGLQREPIDKSRIKGAQARKLLDERDWRASDAYYAALADAATDLLMERGYGVEVCGWFSEARS